LGWGPANIEFRWTKRGPVVIEVNPRLAGTPDPELIQLAYGIDLVDEHIKLFIGEECDLRSRHSRTTSALDSLEHAVAIGNQEPRGC
ncbi:hypothetical protein ACEQ6A_35060, partial [Rhizobium brockwellii]